MANREELQWRCLPITGGWRAIRTLRPNPTARLQRGWDLHTPWWSPKVAAFRRTGWSNRQ